MPKPSTTPLPDLDDDAAFRARLDPLARAVLPSTGAPNIKISGVPDNHTSGAIEAAKRIAAVIEARGPRRRFEYLLPERVGEALAEDAERRGLSAAHRLLEILRDSGYPVIPEDFTDVRRMRRK